MDTILQKKIIPLFHYTLNPDGILFLGSSETIGEFTDLFHSVNAKWKIFRRKGLILEKGKGYPVIPFLDASNEYQKVDTKKATMYFNVREVAEKEIIESFAPPCVFINEKHEKNIINSFNLGNICIPRFGFSRF